MSSVPQSPPPDHRRHFADNLRETALLFVLLAIPAVIFTVWATPAATEAIGRARAGAIYESVMHNAGAGGSDAASMQRPDWVTCWRCGGAGMVDYVIPARSADRDFSLKEPCPLCHGLGQRPNPALERYYR